MGPTPSPQLSSQSSEPQKTSKSLPNSKNQSDSGGGSNTSRKKTFDVRDLHPESERLLDLDEDTIVTEDGYILTMFHVKLRKNTTAPMVSSDQVSESLPILFCHGLFDDGLNLIMQDHKTTLPYKLLEKGYDFWIVSFRGSMFSNTHQAFSSKSSKYWDFSVDELAKYDFTAAVDMVLGMTGKKQLIFIGHSLGCTVGLMGLNLRPEYLSKIKCMILMSPAVTAKYSRKLLIKTVFPIIRCTVAKSKFLRRRKAGMPAIKGTSLDCCLPCLNLRSEKLAAMGMMFFGTFFGTFNFGGNTDEVAVRRMIHHTPAPVSWKLLGHIGQAFPDKCQSFDYGRRGNMKHYGQPKPIQYCSSKITVPTYTFSSIGDYLIPADDVTEVAKQLPNLIAHKQLNDKKFAHGDFLSGRDAHKLIYEDILEIIDRVNQKTDS